MTSPSPRSGSGRHRAKDAGEQWFVEVDRKRPGGARRRRAAKTRRSPLPVAGVAVATAALLGALAMGSAIDNDEVLTAEASTPSEAAPQLLSDEKRADIIHRSLEGVPVPFPRNVQIHDAVAEAEPATEDEAVEAINGKLREWNLTPTGELIDNPCPPHARACVDVENRLAWLQEDGVVTHGPVPNTTGKAGYETPRGEFTVLRHVRDEISWVFNNEPMPFSVYFTDSGVAFHEGSLEQESHGCIHLSMPDAVHFFDTLQTGDIVYVV